MKLINVVCLGVVLELDATDRPQLADALQYSEKRELPGNRTHYAALHTALTACAILAAHDTNLDANTKEEDLLAETRRVWGPLDTWNTPTVRLTEPPQ